MIRKKLFLMIVFIIRCSIHVIAQTDCYYYYQGQKIPLTINENKVCISIPKDCKETSERIRANVQVLSRIKDDDLDIYVISRSDYEKLTSLDSWEEDMKSVILTLCYFTEGEEVFSTPYLNVELKKEEDKDLLASYAEKYKLRIVRNSPLMPLWFILALTPESKMNSVECANEMYESGDFAASIPDLASAGYETTVRIVSTPVSRTSLEIYDLQGRRLSTIPQKGMYFQNGEKKLVK